MNFNSSDLISTSPILLLSVLTFLILTLEALMKKSESVIFSVTILGILGCIGAAIVTFPLKGTAFNSMVITGGYANFFDILFLLAAGLTILISKNYLEKEGINYGAYYSLVLFATIGMMFMASAGDLVIIFLGLELMSISLYVLAGFMRKKLKSNESALKYFLLGAFTTGFLLYGIALIYGMAGTTNLGVILNNFSSLTQEPLFWIGIGLLMVGFFFKVAGTPFHMWVPDVYEGAPTTVSAFMSTGGKAAAFAAFVLVFTHFFSTSGTKVSEVIAVVSAASMIIGNVVAISQNNIKRMLAYSSIAHAGYMLTGLAAANQLGQSGILYYLVAYSFMNIGAFGFVSIFEKEEEKNLTFDDYVGLGYKKPFVAALMSIFMFSLSGIPPFAGFFGKYYVFTAAVKADLTWLAIIGVLTSVISVYYYLRLVVVMYFQEDEGGLTLAPISSGFEVSKLSLTALVISAIGVIQLGILPSWIIDITQRLF